MAEEPVRKAALAAGAGFVGLAAFQAALALGAPLGRASWGGVHEGRLPRGLRIVSGVAVGFHALAAQIVLGRGGYRVVPLPGSVLRRGTWALGALLLVGAVPNFASSSRWERFGWGPVTVILAGLCLMVALRGGRGSGEG